MEAILMIYAALMCAAQAEVVILAMLVIAWFAGSRCGRKTTEETTAEDADVDRAWRETLSQLLDYSADTARKAAREEE